MNKNIDISNIIEMIKNMDFEPLMNVLEYVILYYVVKAINREDEATYNFHKEFIPKDISKVVLPPELIQKETEVDYEKLSAEWFGEQVIEFAKFMEKEFSQADLVNFYNNINRLVVEAYEPKRKRIIINKLSRKIGIYNAIRNKISIEKDYIKTSIFHELFHMASARYVDGWLYGGFEQISSDNSFIIGRGLNEGYTQLLAERYFGHIEGVKGTYPYLVKVAGLLEEIVGADKMTSLYLRADLPGLINELKEYASEDEISKFLSALDFVEKFLNDPPGLPFEDALITQSLVTINEFLLKLGGIKAGKMFMRGEFKNEDDFSNFLGKYINNIGFGIEIDNRKYFYLDEERIKEIIFKNLFKKSREYVANEAKAKM